MRNRASVYGRQSSGKAKSIREQLAAGHGVTRENGWRHAGDYRDGTGASRQATKARSDWERLLADLEAAAFDIIILWESSRGDRTLASWALFLEQCRKHDVLIHVIADDHTYDMKRPRDWKTLATAGVDAQGETDLLSIRVKRGHAGAAADGKPAGGPVPYGYRRTYDTATGKRRDQVPYEPEAAIVREIFDRVATGQTILSLVNDLNDRRVPRARGAKWARCTVREVVRNRAYISRRFLNGVEHQGTWPAIVEESVFYAAQEVLAQPSRRITRPGRQKHLLSYLARCATCDAFLNYAAGYYKCVDSGCVSIPKGATDMVVAEYVQARLTQPNMAAILAPDNSEEAEQAAAEAAKMRAQLNEWRQSAILGQTSPASLVVIEAQLTAKIADAEAQSRTASIPPVLQSFLDPETDVRRRWDSFTVVARRVVVSALCEVRVGPGRPGRRRADHSIERSTFARLGESRWRQDTRTWAEL